MRIILIMLLLFGFMFSFANAQQTPLSKPEDGMNVSLRIGSTGEWVQLVQNRLQAAGFYEGNCHGTFDKETRHAVFKFQSNQHLPITGEIHYVELMKLGLVE